MTYVLGNAPTTNNGLREIEVTEFHNGSVIAIVSAEYESGTTVSASELEEVISSNAASDTLADGNNSLVVDVNSITGEINVLICGIEWLIFSGV